MHHKMALLFLVVVIVVPLTACSPKIHGTVQLLDMDMKPVAEESPKGTVVNLINTSVSLEHASHSFIVNEEGTFESAKEEIKPGLYIIEAAREGYLTQTKIMEIGRCSSEEVTLKIKKIPEGKRMSIEGAALDEDKIINPGEVNIRPPMM